MPAAVAVVLKQDQEAVVVLAAVADKVHLEHQILVVVQVVEELVVEQDLMVDLVS
jgi:hypothetical protein